MCGMISSSKPSHSNKIWNQTILSRWSPKKCLLDIIILLTPVGCKTLLFFSLLLALIVTLIIKISFLAFRSSPLYKWTQCIHTTFGQFIGRKNTERKLGRCIQIPADSTSPSSIWKRGKWPERKFKMRN